MLKGVVGVHHEWDLEATFDGDEISVWLTDNINLGLACALLYLAAVFVGKKYMENQPRYGQYIKVEPKNVLLIFKKRGVQILGKYP